VEGCSEPWQWSPLSTSTSTRFTKLENLDLDVAGELCRRAAQLVAAGRFAM
jgi:hypothetical protein